MEDKKTLPEGERKIVHRAEVLSVALTKLKREIERDPFSPERVAALAEAVKILS